MAAVSSSSHLVLLLRSHSPSASSSSSLTSFLKPLFISSSNALKQFHNVPTLPKNFFPSPFFSSSFSSLAFPHTPPLSALVGASAPKSIEEDDVMEMEQYGEETDEDEDHEMETERGNFEDTQMDLDSTSSPLERKREERLKLELPNLTVKERKELASYAHSLGKKLKTQLVGKSGVTSNVATSFIETLEANELLKIKIHRSCPGELDDVVKQLEEATGSVTVGKIGRTLIIYRPSLTKLKAEEKKKQVRKFILKKQQYKTRMSKEQGPKLSRGSTWKRRDDWS